MRRRCPADNPKSSGRGLGKSGGGGAQRGKAEHGNGGWKSSRRARRLPSTVAVLGLAALSTSAATLSEAASRRLGVVRRAPPAHSRDHAAPYRAARHFGVGDARRLPHTEIRTVRV